MPSLATVEGLRKETSNAWEANPSPRGCSQQVTCFCCRNAANTSLAFAGGRHCRPATGPGKCPLTRARVPEVRTVSPSGVRCRLPSTAVRSHESPDLQSLRAPSLPDGFRIRESFRSGHPFGAVRPSNPSRHGELQGARGSRQRKTCRAVKC